MHVNRQAAPDTEFQGLSYFPYLSFNNANFVWRSIGPKFLQSSPDTFDHPASLRLGENVACTIRVSWIGLGSNLSHGLGDKASLPQATGYITFNRNILWCLTKYELYRARKVTFLFKYLKYTRYKTRKKLWKLTYFCIKLIIYHQERWYERNWRLGRMWGSIHKDWHQLWIHIWRQYIDCCDVK